LLKGDIITLLPQHLSIHHFRLDDREIVTSARNHLSRDLWSHVLESEDGLLGVVNLLVFAHREQRGRAKTSEFVIL